MTEHDDPKVPLAVCGRDHTHWLRFEVCPYTRKWVVGCPKCEDGEYDCEGVCRRTDPTGDGDTPWEALRYYAEVHFDLCPQDLVISEEHV